MIFLVFTRILFFPEKFFFQKFSLLRFCKHAKVRGGWVGGGGWQKGRNVVAFLVIEYFPGFGNHILQ